MSAPGDADEALALLAASPVFAAFFPDDLEALATHGDGLRFEQHPEGALLVREGEHADTLLVLRRGQAQVLKRGEGGGEHEVNRIGPGDCIGELAVIDPAPRSASVRAATPVEVLVIPTSALLALAGERPRFALGLLGQARRLAERLRQLTQTTVDTLERALDEERTRRAMGKFVFMLIVTYSLYTWVLGTATQVKQALGRSELVTLPAVIVTVGILGWFMRSSGYPRSFFGLTLGNVRRHLLESLALTLMAGTVALKWALVQWVPSMAGQPLIQMGSPPAPGLPASSFDPWLMLAFVVFVPWECGRQESAPAPRRPRLPA